jgi:Heterokaryon incompatibility protein (HET)
VEVVIVKSNFKQEITHNNININMPKKEVNNKIVNSLLNQNKIIQDLKEQFGNQVHLAIDIEEFKQVVNAKNYDHVFCLYQLQDNTWGVININQKPGYGNYWFSLSNWERGQKEVKEINKFLNPLSVKYSSYTVDYRQSINTSRDISKESAISSLEVLIRYLSLLKEKGDWWAWVDLKTTLARQQELSQEYDRIKQQLKKERFVEEFQKAAQEEGIDIDGLGSKEQIIKGYWQEDYNGEQAWKISKILKERKEQQLLNSKNQLKSLQSKLQSRGSKKNVDREVSQSEQGEQEQLNILSKEVDQATEKLIESSQKLEETEEKRIDSIKEVFSSSRKEKMVEVGKVKEKLKDSNKELIEAKENVNNSKKELNAKSQELSEKIKTCKEKLEEEKKSCANEIEKGDNLVGKIVRMGKETITGEDVSKKIEKLLKAQAEITRHDSFFANEVKRELLEEMQKFSEKLNNLCNKQVKITELEMQLEDAEKTFQIIELTNPEEREYLEKEVELAPNIYPELFREIKKEAEGNKPEAVGLGFKETYKFNPREINYEGVFLMKDNPSWKNSKSPDSWGLPTRLVDCKKVEESNLLESVKEGVKTPVEEIERIRKAVKKMEKTGNINYAIASYVWGNWKDRTDFPPGTKKTLVKTIKALETINKERQERGSEKINYLWVDQLCIDQSDPKDKGREVSGMHQYYNNADLTLVAIQRKLGEEKDLINILKMIVNSGWFERSWIFQEGWLGKHTIFVFDDKLVDGRELAAVWVLHQPSYSNYAKFGSLEEAGEGTKKIATPIGWTYYEDGYSLEDKVPIRLNQALRSIKGRGRTCPIDGIYSVLGLLPYGKDVVPKYKFSICLDCGYSEGDKVESECKNSEHKNKRWPTYDKEDIRSALFEVMKTAVDNGHTEILTWHGTGNWIPKTYDKNYKDGSEIEIVEGGTSISGGVEISNDALRNSVRVVKKDSEDVIELTVSKYTIDGLEKDVVQVERGFLVDGGVNQREVYINSNRITLSGTFETLNKMEVGDFLLMPNQESKTNKSFAIIASIEDKNEYKVCHRKGLVELSRKQSKKLVNNSTSQEEKIIITPQYEARIEINANQK